MYALAFFFFLMGMPLAAHSQELVQLYHEARIRVRIEQILEEERRLVKPMPPQVLSSPADSIAARVREWMPRPEPEPIPEPVPFLTTSVEKVLRLQRPSFLSRFGETEFIGAGVYHVTPIDSIPTSMLRGQLEALFGPPTETVMDIRQDGPPQPGDFIQFSYWFIVNDSIPVKVMDLDGPCQTGLVFVGDRAYRSALPEIKQMIVDTLVSAPAPRPFVDYYHAFDRQQWFIVGYDGSEFFENPIRTPDYRKGRPLLELIRGSEQR